MTRIAAALVSVLILSSLPSAIAGPACARRNWKATDCIAKCASKFGYPGMAMGMDPWGTVMKPETKGMNEYVSEACGSAKPTSSVSPAATQPTVSAQTVAPVPTGSNRGPSPSVHTTSHTSAKPSVTVANAVNSPSPKPKSPTPPPPATSVHTPPPPPRTSPKSPPPPQTSAQPPSPPPPQTAGGLSSGGSSGGTSDSDIAAYLNDHNTIRAQHGAKPLTWSNDLASKAQEWANRCKFVHSGGTLGPFGENLAAGTGSSYGISAGIKSWSDEVSQYDSSNPVPSHFTQMVWKASTQVGCAEANCNGIFPSSFGVAKYYVCEYSPQGNVIGEFAQNVQA